MTNTPDSDDAFVTGISSMTPAERIDALLDVVSDTAQWQFADALDWQRACAAADADEAGRAR